MRQLSGHDAGYLYADTAHSNANVSLLHIYDQSTAPGGVVRFKQILAHLERRLHRAPLFRQRLQRVPLGLDHPYWVDDENFDLEYHVRHIALPKPGDWRQFCIQASRIHARALDLDRPLWELYVIEGLDSFLDLPVGSFALLLKTHLAAIDLGAVSALTALLHDTDATAADSGPPEPWFADSPPGRLALVARGAVQSASAPLRLARPLWRVASHVAPAAAALAREMLLRPEHLAPTRFNSVVSPHRVFETRRFTDAEFDSVRGLVPGATLDDAVLAVCGGALRRYLDHHGELPEGHGLSAISPAGHDADGHVDDGPTWRHLALHTDLADPIERLAAIRDQRHAAPDAVAQALGSREWREAGEQASATMLAWSRRLAQRAGAQLGRRAPPAHCTITHIPAPAQPQYLCGARMTYTSAIVPITDGLGLAFAVTRYDGRVVISPTSCRELMPDPEQFALYLRDSFQEYLALAAQAKPQATKATRARKPSQAIAAKRGASGRGRRAAG
ncbi:wax ester/triacylglycerol synthase domain-containing protein [Ideonella sp. DXS22W]|uniref:diacylglycerol O-acyltransferase n=1 Tax=Pseudaquabacterium inlustre TaxID=2984192 RepID=A0ABU9CBA5_9BURK